MRKTASGCRIHLREGPQEDGIANQVSLDKNYGKVFCTDFMLLQEMLHNGYYPTDIIKGEYICHRIKGHSDEKVVHLKQMADVA